MPGLRPASGRPRRPHPRPPSGSSLHAHAGSSARLRARAVCPPGRRRAPSLRAPSLRTLSRSPSREPPRERACGRLRPQTQKFRRDRRSACPRSRSWSPAADGDPPTAGTGAGAPQPQTDRDAGRGLHVGSVVLCWARGAGAGPRPDWGACPPTSSVGPASSAMSQRWGGVGGGCPNSSFSRVPGPRWQSGET